MPNLYCTFCDYSTCKKSSFDKHLGTNKHKNQENDIENSQQKVSKYQCDCGKIYKYDSGYYRHKKICSDIKTSNEISDKELIKILMKQNTELIEQNSKLIQQI